MTLLTLDTYQPQPLVLGKSTPPRTGLQRLFAAAIINHQFRETLLKKPEDALLAGYLGQTFSLTDQERTIIKSIRAETITDLAQKVNRALKGA